jgi:hypothetical protein
MKPLCLTFYRCRSDGVAKTLALPLGYVIKLPQLNTIFVVNIPKYTLFIYASNDGECNIWRPTMCIDETVQLQHSFCCAIAQCKAAPSKRSPARRLVSSIAIIGVLVESRNLTLPASGSAVELSREIKSKQSRYFILIL